MLSVKRSCTNEVRGKDLVACARRVGLLLGRGRILFSRTDFFGGVAHWIRGGKEVPSVHSKIMSRPNCGIGESGSRRKGH